MNVGRRLMTAASQEEVVAKAALVAGVCGGLSTVPFAPPLQALLLLVFVLAGPGSAVVCWLEFPPAVTVAAVVGISVASVLALAVATAWMAVWLPIPSCLLLSAVGVTSGFARLRNLRMSMQHNSGRW